MSSTSIEPVEKCTETELQKMMEYVRRGDIVIVESISRFARNTRDLLELVERLTDKGVGIYIPEGGDRHYDAHWKVMLTVFGAVAELEREYISSGSGKELRLQKVRVDTRGENPLSRQVWTQLYGGWRAGELTAAEAMRSWTYHPAHFIEKQKDSPVKRIFFCIHGQKKRFSRLSAYSRSVFVQLWRRREIGSSAWTSALPNRI